MTTTETTQTDHHTYGEDGFCIYCHTVHRTDNNARQQAPCKGGEKPAPEPPPQITLAEFIAEHGITMTARRAASNRNMPDSEGMDHWLCTLKRPTLGSSPRSVAGMRVTFSMGSGHHGAAPDAATVLDCLASDASNADQAFSDWCSDLGYDEDSRSAYRTFRACQRCADKLKKFLGADALEQLTFRTERL